MYLKKAVLKAIFLPIWLVLIFVCISAVLLIYVFKEGNTDSFLSIFTYVFSFYTLTVLIAVICKKLPPTVKKLKSGVLGNKYTSRYFEDVRFKNDVNLVISFSFNLIYVAVNAVHSVRYNTNWFGIFAVYYAILAVMRFLMIVSARRKNVKRKSELIVARVCAFILFAVNLFLTGAILMILYFDKGFEYEGYLIYVAALYSFYLIISSVVDMVKFKKYNSPLMSVSKIVKFTSALVSMLTLETAMLSQFGNDMPAETQKIMIAATGGGISVIIIVLALYVIVKTTRELLDSRNSSF